MQRACKVKLASLVVGGGRGERMGADVPKQFLRLKERSILYETLSKLERSDKIDALYLIVPKERVLQVKEEFKEFKKLKGISSGGIRRQDSVRIGLEMIDPIYEYVLIHDAVRPFIDTQLIERLVDAAAEYGAASTGIPLKESIGVIDIDGNIKEWPERREIWIIQTPQIFKLKEILKAHRKAERESWGTFHDDTSLAHKAGIKVKMVLGDEKNIKITTSFDLELARFLYNISGKSL
ncbi:MAG TPA: 2-C-methyl-D-erythritol 4-phosphate cytidylyltransferase [Desulfobacteraceae bacterium]|nr:2-C-methyl-D-erythritol 4-phosphate cytidylyltransferase [Desulfobacteraceae bacterium]